MMQYFNDIQIGSIILYVPITFLNDHTQCIGVVRVKEEIKDIPGIGTEYVVMVYGRAWPIDWIVKVICE